MRKRRLELRFRTRRASAADIFSANAALMTVRHVSQLGPAKNGPNSFELAIASETLIVTCFMSRPRLLLSFDFESDVAQGWHRDVSRPALQTDSL